MARGKKTEPVAVEDLPGEEPEPETSGPEYPHCACGAVLALDEEKAAGVCESS
jgi:hypothetical protein